MPCTSRRCASSATRRSTVSLAECLQHVVADSRQRARQDAQSFREQRPRTTGCRPVYPVRAGRGPVPGSKPRQESVCRYLHVDRSGESQGQGFCRHVAEGTDRTTAGSATFSTTHSSVSVQSVRLNGHDPWAYLRDVLARLPTLPKHPLKRESISLQSVPSATKPSLGRLPPASRAPFQQLRHPLAARRLCDERPVGVAAP
ncbi:transposase domain-containing protein [Pelomonas sp. Root1444]|uniref:transposase domain-containing protein n=1 Tax=Pelomonas sp. Root1444 TaxID=1736464 RepID=UPI001F482573|nr:transposase domain-containing protein [Pelomonas sp. Root1444]